MSLHESEHRREAEAVPLLLGAEERLEDVGARLGVHADARVLDLEARIGAALEVLAAEPARELLGCEVLARRADDHGAGALPDGVGGVQHQIHQHLLELHDVGVHLERLAREVELERDASGQRGGEQIGERAGQLRQLHRAHLGRPAPRVREQLLHEPRRALGGLFGVAERFGAVLGRRVARSRIAHARQDHGEQVVEVVRDAAREHAEALELARLLELEREVLLVPARLLELGHVGDDALERGRARVGDRGSHAREMPLARRRRPRGAA